MPYHLNDEILKVFQVPFETDSLKSYLIVSVNEKGNWPDKKIPKVDFGQFFEFF